MKSIAESNRPSPRSIDCRLPVNLASRTSIFSKILRAARARDAGAEGRIVLPVGAVSSSTWRSSDRSRVVPHVLCARRERIHALLQRINRAFSATLRCRARLARKLRTGSQQMATRRPDSSFEGSRGNGCERSAGCRPHVRGPHHRSKRVRTATGLSRLRRFPRVHARGSRGLFAAQRAEPFHVGAIVPAISHANTALRIRRVVFTRAYGGKVTRSRSPSASPASR